ncbi:alpha-L-fucosidase [Paenibacillus prosopidis]|uniref:alpha-L-fucosidase n=1 Tax=Paenibacillus prosopidis TaxID=630520 RepID=A0A368W2I0_9BACL|nr:alpha-L-fucosidase [Paenibacillus prosopidis]RCW49006.1 carbohydrate binding protein with CBM6 domain [Paenibacillus prosopidis]
MLKSMKNGIVSPNGSPNGRNTKIRLRKFCFTLLAVSLSLLSFPYSPLANAEPDGTEQALVSTGVNPVPEVVPSLREWNGGTGSFSLEVKSQVVVDSVYADQLQDDAEVFVDDLETMSGMRLSIKVSQEPKPGDLFLTLDESVKKDEGYALNIEDGITIQGKTDTGVFYGLQTVLQILKQDPAHRSLPRGTANDYPDTGFRSFMIDSGHTFATLGYIEQMIRQIAWHKLNTLHIHFTDAEGFRLESDTYPGLASEGQSYSKADIREMQDLAKKYHITIIPEIDVPGHATAMINYNPNLKFPTGDHFDTGWTIDITREENREWVKGLLKEFLPLFDGPIFHIGGDEYQTDAKTALSPEIIQYANDRGFKKRADVFVDFTNEINDLVKSYGKRTMIWNWWDIEQENDLQPDKDIIVEAWRGSPLKYTEMGYDVVNSDEVVLYTGPTDPPGYPTDSNRVYKTWTIPQDPKLIGFSLSNWTGGWMGPRLSDDYFEWFNRRPREAMAERIWGGPLSATTADFESRVDRIGTAPGIPEYAPYGGEKLTGTPFGTAPGYDGSSTYDKAFDGEPGTFFDYVNPNDGYTGIDLGEGNAKTVNKIRFLPRLDYTARVTGGKFQGSNEGPDKGFVDLFTVNWTADNGWTEVPVKDATPYRFLRYVSPDNGYTNMAEVEFYTASPNNAKVSANAVIQAHEYSDKKGGIQLENDISPDNTSIGNIKAGSWVKYDRVDFNGGFYDSFMASIAFDGDTGDQPIEIRLDAADGRLIGVLNPQSTGGGNIFQEQYASVSYVSGIHDLYLVFPSETNLYLNWFVFGTNSDEESAEAKERRTQWYTNARFGGLFRFGAFTQLAGTYNGQTQEQAAGELIMNWADISKEDYLNLAAKPFNPTSFDAQKWVAAAKAAGEKYIVVTAKDRDGFSMYDTKVNVFSDFSIMGTSAYGKEKDNKDPVAALAAESKKQGLKFGIYYSISDWYHQSQTRNADGTTTMADGAKDTYVSEMKEQLRELIENVSPDLIWFDGSDGGWWTEDDAKSLYKYVRTLKSGIVVSSGIGGGIGDFNTEEQSDSTAELPKENRIPLNDSYGYVSYDSSWKSAGGIVNDLAEAVSAGGNLLLGAGPKPDGTLPEESETVLKQIGDWLSLNGDSIYDAKASVYTETQSWGDATSKRGKLYLHVAKWPADGQLIIPSLLNEIVRIYPINDESTEYTYTVDGEQTVISVPLEAPDTSDSVIVLNVDGIPQAMPGIPLLGEAYGKEPTYDPYSTFDKVFDGKINTYYDYLGPSDGYAGLDLGEGNAQQVTYIRFYPRIYFEGRMLGGKFQGSNEGPDEGFVDLATINTVPLSTWNNIKVDNPGTYRWIRYVSPANGYTNVAEVQFYGE